jgi:hypothetical protein
MFPKIRDPRGCGESRKLAGVIPANARAANTAATAAGRSCVDGHVKRVDKGKPQMRPVNE